MIILVVCGTVALLPSVLLVRYFVRSDRYPEPTSVLWGTFLRGFAILFPVCILELVLSVALEDVGGAITQAFILAFVVAAACEESFKFIVLHWYCGRHPEFDEPMDAVVYGAVASLGFATLENILYVAQGGLWVAITRAVTVVPAHACFGAVMGYYYAKVRFGSPRERSLVPVLAVPILLHGLYDLPLFLLDFQENLVVIFGLYVFFVILLCYLYTRTRAIVADLQARQLEVRPKENPAPAREPF